MIYLLLMYAFVSSYLNSSEKRNVLLYFSWCFYYSIQTNWLILEYDEIWNLETVVYINILFYFLLLSYKMDFNLKFKSENVFFLRAPSLYYKFKIHGYL